MDKPNLYAEFIENYDLDSLISIARTKTLTAENKLALIEAFETTLSYLSYEYDCKKMSDIGPDYLEAALALGDLKGEKNYLGINNYYFYLIDIRKDVASSTEVNQWLDLLEQNINESLTAQPDAEKMLYHQIHFLKVRSEVHKHVDPQNVKSIFDAIKNAAKRFPNSNFWSSWLYALIDFKDHAMPEVIQIVNHSLEDFNSLSESLYKSKQLDPIEFYKQLGGYHFLKVLPDKVKSKIGFWIHEALQAERPKLAALSNDRLRDQGILYINAYENHIANDEVIEHAVALNTLSWERVQNWNSLLFYLRSKALYAQHLKKNGNLKAGLDVFQEAFQVAEQVRKSVDLYNRDCFSIASPLLEFYQYFILETPNQEERIKLSKLRLEVAVAAIATGEGSYLFPFEHHMMAAAYLSLPEDFKRSWMQMCIVLCRYAHSIYDAWKDQDFVKKNSSIAELLQKSAFLFTEGADFELHRYHKKYPVILHTLSDSELSSEFERFLGYAKNHQTLNKGS
jgi:hypothetical protein